MRLRGEFKLIAEAFMVELLQWLEHGGDSNLRLYE